MESFNYNNIHYEWNFYQHNNYSLLQLMVNTSELIKTIIYITDIITLSGKL